MERNDARCRWAEQKKARARAANDRDGTHATRMSLSPMQLVYERVVRIGISHYIQSIIRHHAPGT